jgi:hypothetical protein
VNLTREQIRGAPGIEEDQPVSLQHQAELAAYYAWPLPYEGLAPITAGLPATPIPEPIPGRTPDETHGDPHLRSLREVLGYRIVAGEREAGKLEDLELDDQLRVLALLSGDLRVAPEKVTEFDWAAQIVRISA